MVVVGLCAFAIQDYAIQSNDPLLEGHSWMYGMMRMARQRELSSCLELMRSKLCIRTACSCTASKVPVSVQQESTSPRIVPRVVLELAPQQLAGVLGNPSPMARLLRRLCDQHLFDGLVWPLLCCNHTLFCHHS